MDLGGLKLNKGVLLPLIFHIMCSCSNPVLTDACFYDKNLILYVVADNNLTSYSDSLLNYIITAEIPSGCNILAYIDNDKEPILYSKNEGELTVIHRYNEMNSLSDISFRDFFASVTHDYPAKETGLVLWSHGTGWLPSGSNTRSFGDDNGNTVNIDKLSEILYGLKPDYLILDACLMGTVETLWELRNTSKYIISSPALIPSIGIFRNNSTEILFSNESVEQRLKKLCNNYIYTNESYSGEKCISMVETEKLKILADSIRNIRKFSPLAISDFPYFEFRSQKVFFDFRVLLGKFQKEHLFDDYIYYSCSSYNNQEILLSGLSIFIPYDGNRAYHQSYVDLNWNKYTHWIDKFFF